MTYLRAATLATDVLGRDTGASTNPEQDIARLTQADHGTGSLLTWLCGTTLVRAFANRRAERHLTRTIARLAETSPHLLADIGIIDTPMIAPDMPVRARFQAPGKELRIVAAPVPVATRPAQRPAVIIPRVGPESVVVHAPVPEIGREQTAAR